MKEYINRLVQTISILPITFILTKLLDRILKTLIERRNIKINKLKRKQRLELKILKLKQKIQLLETELQGVEQEN